MSEVVSLSFKKINEGSSEVIGIIGINRPDSANAFNAEVIEKMTECLQEVEKNTACRALVLMGHGKHFSAGADLGWMKAAASLSLEDNLKSARGMQEMFEALNGLSKPSLCLVQGAAFGGAVGLAAAADVCLAFDTAKFCLSEVRLGILPAVIFPYLSRKINAGQLRRLSLTAKTFSGVDALAYGLVQVVVDKNNVEEKIREEINGFLLGGPQAQSRLKLLLKDLELTPNQSEATVKAISEARVGAEAKSGFDAFFAKEATPWKCELSEGWSLND